jgi:hypothetical protein
LSSEHADGDQSKILEMVPRTRILADLPEDSDIVVLNIDTFIPLEILGNVVHHFLHGWHPHIVEKNHASLIE